MYLMLYYAMLYIEKRSGLPFQTESGWWIQVSSRASCCAATSFFFYYYYSQVPTQARLVPECVPLLLAGFMQIDVCV